jgi:mannose-1-phosphate guanylyltransferase
MERLTAGRTSGVLVHELCGWGMDIEQRQAFSGSTERYEDSSISVMRSKRPGAGQVVPVILSGGGGSRLWPVSTSVKPKQFLPLVGERTLLQETLARVEDRFRFAAPIIVGSVQHAELCEKEIVADVEARLILEPCARNTAPAIAMAALVVEAKYGPDALLLVMPSDHVIDDVTAFHAAIATAEPAARQGRLVTFGIWPTDPETGYGYLHMGPEVSPGVMQVTRFVEKPAMDVAEAMVAGGEHLWNAGIFLFRARTVLDELERLAPEIARYAANAIRSGSQDGIRIAPNFDDLNNCPSDSIDYAVMEHASDVVVVPMSSGWSDLGSWDALAALAGSGPANGLVTAVECDDCYIRSDEVEVAALGVSDLIIVASGQRLLVLPRGRSQEVKRLLSARESSAA